MKSLFKKALIGRYSAAMRTSPTRCTRCNRVGNHAKWCEHKPQLVPAVPTPATTNLLNKLATKRRGAS